MNEARPVARRRFLFFVCLAVGALPAARVAAATGPAGAGRTAAAVSAADRCRSLIALSQTLVATAQSGTGQATRFRVDVVHYREVLRDLMKEDAERAQAQRLPRPLLMEMVRMVALLQAAAECQTGRYIVCPADLIVRLNRQQALVADTAARLLPAGG